VRGPLSFRTTSNGPWKLTEELPRRTKIFVAPYLIDTDFLTETDMETDTEIDADIDTDIDTNIDMDIDRDMDKDTDMELEYICFPYGTIVAIAPYGLPATHHGASSNSAINL
jgi:hypothetical protein